MKTSETVGKISADLAKAQAILKNPGKDAVNPHFRNSYATLDAGLNICREALSKHGIALIQATRVDGDILILETRLSHASGEWMEGEYPVCRFPIKPQEMGSCMSYAKRYALFSFVGIAGEDDDDGNAANNTTVSAPKKLSATSEERSQEILDGLINTLGKAETIEAVDKWVSANMATIAKMLPNHKEELRDEIKAWKNDILKEMSEDAA